MRGFGVVSRWFFTKKLSETTLPRRYAKKNSEKSGKTVKNAKISENRQDLHRCGSSSFGMTYKWEIVKNSTFSPFFSYLGKNAILQFFSHFLEKSIKKASQMELPKEKIGKFNKKLEKTTYF